ncbi:unnamed protein product [Moneuplotes crassus]|uniref:Casein kinase I n=1 Tax=Euplotes crassus TaxID=5936 RepID=A0AAD2CZP0_EUPCR|nr:unnamed protein product [Moneuplotes crassus]
MMLKLNKTVAIKTEHNMADNPMLETEAQIIKELSGVRGIPQLHDYLNYKDFKVLSMPLYGFSLAHLKHYLGGKFSLWTTCMVGLKLIDRLKDVHNRGFIHRDIKPHNVVIGREDPTEIFLIDFGLAKRFVDPKTKLHIPLKTHPRVVGTAKYISLRCHYGYESSRRDDLESLVYVLIYLATGTLPWKHDGQVTRSKLEQIKQTKSIKASDICAGLPREFHKMLRITRNLGFKEDPDYCELKKLLRRVISKAKTKKADLQLDWVEKQELLPKKYGFSKSKKGGRPQSCKRVQEYPKLRL